MAAYLLRRLFQSALILLGVSFITFVLLYVLPADPVRQIAGRSATAQTVENIRRELGLDQPFLLQYGRYLWGLVQGDLGRSYLQKSQVSELIASRLPATLLLMLGAILCELVIGLTFGILAALKRGTMLDQTLMMTSFVTVSAPQFVVSLLLLYVFAVKLGWFPIGGYGTFAHLVLPALTLGILGSGWYSRMMRSSMIEVMRADFIRTARAKGLGRLRVVLGACAAQRGAARDCDDRHRHRHFHGRYRGGRKRFRLARYRPTGVAGHSARGYPDHHGRHAGVGLCHRLGQPSGRSGCPVHRPPYQVEMIKLK